MSEWKKVPIKDVCVGIYDGPHATPPVSETGGIFLGISNITKDGHFDFSSIKYIGDDYMPKWTKRVTPQKDDIVFSYEATLNLYAVIPDGFYGCLGRRMALIRTNKQLVNHKYLFYYFFSKNWRNLISEKTIVGATVDRIPIATFPDFEIELPSLDVQNKIATILSRYDTLIENYQKQIKLLEESAQRLYKEWFIDLRFPGHENTKIVDGIPEGWEKKTLSDIATIIMGQSPKSEFYNSVRNGLPFHQGVGSYGFRFVVDNVYSTSFTRIAESNSILFSVRAPVGRLNITKNKIVIGRGLAAINHKKGHQSFLYYLLKEKFFKDNIIGNGAIFASISKDELYNQVFVIPSDEMVMRYDTIANKIDKDIQYIDSQIYFLTEGRDRLLPKLMSGEIEV